MGFNKYMQMSKSAESLFQAYTAQRLNVEKEKLEYLQLVDEKKKHQDTLAQYETQLQDALQYAVSNKELYDNLKSGLNQEVTIKNRLDKPKLRLKKTHP